MAITMVRKPSETPNISNTDDFIGLRYAYGNQDGYIIGKGKELEYKDDGSKFIIQSGRIVLQGVECDIDANGVLVPVDNISTKSYYTVYLEVNLAINESKIVERFDTVDYPKIDKGDDLTKNISGTARLELYRFVAQDGLISNVEKIIKPVKYLKDVVVKDANNAHFLSSCSKTDDAKDIELADKEKVPTAFAIKQFMEEYFMKVITGTVTCISSKVGNMKYNYITKQSGRVILCVVFDSLVSTAASVGENIIFSLQLSEEFYNKAKQIVCQPSNHSSYYVVISNTGILNFIYKRMKSEVQTYFTGGSFKLEYVV